jgi:hypothetical protein
MVSVMTYEDAKLPLGAGREYRFTGAVPAAELYALLKDRLDQRFVAALHEPIGSTPAWSFAVKLLGHKSAEGHDDHRFDGCDFLHARQRRFAHMALSRYR